MNDRVEKGRRKAQELALIAVEEFKERLKREPHQPPSRKWKKRYRENSEEDARCKNWFYEMQKADSRLRNYPDGNGLANPNKPIEACMRWAIRFAYLNLKEVGEKNWVAIQNELDCLLTYQAKEPDKNEPPRFRYRMFKDFVVRIQKDFRKQIESVIKKEHIGCKIPEEFHQLQPPKSDSDTWNIWTLCLEEADTIKHGNVLFFRLLEKQVNNLSRCPAFDCQEVFLKDRSNQVFCSSTCQWRTATRKLRKTPLDRVGKRGRPRKNNLTIVADKSSPQKSNGGSHGPKKR